MHFSATDEWSMADALRLIRFVRGGLHFSADDVRGRCMKTDLQVRSDGTFTLTTTNVVRPRAGGSVACTARNHWSQSRRFASPILVWDPANKLPGLAMLTVSAADLCETPTHWVPKHALWRAATRLNPRANAFHVTPR
jgi:hypothetical protein